MLLSGCAPADRYGCAVRAVADAAGRPYAEVRAIALRQGVTAWDLQQGGGLSEAQVRRLADAYGVRVAIAPVVVLGRGHARRVE